MRYEPYRVASFSFMHLFLVRRLQKFDFRIKTSYTIILEITFSPICECTCIVDLELHPFYSIHGLD